MVPPPDGFIAELAVKRVAEGIQGGNNFSVPVSFRNQFFKDCPHGAGIPVFRQGGYRADSAVGNHLAVQPGFIVIVDNPGHDLPVIGKGAPVLVLALQTLLPVLFRIFHLHMESYGGDQVCLKMFFRFQSAYFHLYVCSCKSFFGGQSFSRPVFLNHGKDLQVRGKPVHILQFLPAQPPGGFMLQQFRFP